MDGRYIAFDVETPNFANDRMSAIGITVVEDGKIVEEYDTLVNPEEPFDRFNIRLTGITPEMVVDKPPFPRLWQEIEPIMGSGVLVAHNAPFDLSVLAKCLQAYGIDWHSSVRYACTCQMSRRLLPQLPDHKLNVRVSESGSAPPPRRQRQSGLRRDSAAPSAVRCGSGAVYPDLRFDASAHSPAQMRRRAEHGKH